VVPAYNEEARIGAVLPALLAAPELDEILVVNDGSRDGTAAVSRRFRAVRTLDLPENRGKGAAMRVGALETDADFLLFIDADLIGLNAGHVADLLRPVLDDLAEMTVGVFRGGRLATDLSHFLVSYISGQRALSRELFLAIPGISASRSGVETAITKYVKARGLRVRNVAMQGVTHPMKEEKLGLLPGVTARLKMYWEIGKSLTDGRRLNDDVHPAWGAPRMENAKTRKGENAKSR
jgi:glycosyltransferase involved in cell wall biosynthesis